MLLRKSLTLSIFLQLIREKTEAVINSPYLHLMKLSTLKTIVEQDVLCIKEIELFNAVESIAKKQGLINGTRLDANYNSTALQKLPLWQEFRAIIQQIRFLSMKRDVFEDGPAFSVLLTDGEAFSISVCITKPNKIESFYPQGFIKSKRLLPFPRFFFDIEDSGQSMGRIVIELRSDVVPIAFKNFHDICTGKRDYGYKGARLFVCAEYCLTKAINSSGKDVKLPCDHENFVLKHTGMGDVGLCNTANNASQSNVTSFFITFNKLVEVDGKYVIIGKVVEGLDVLEKVKSKGVSGATICVKDCGEL